MNATSSRLRAQGMVWATFILAAAWSLNSLGQAPAAAPQASGGSPAMEVASAQPTSDTVPGWLTRELFESLVPGMKQDQVLDYIGRDYCKLDSRGTYGETYVCPDGPRSMALHFDARRLLEWTTQAGLE